MEVRGFGLDAKGSYFGKGEVNSDKKGGHMLRITRNIYLGLGMAIALAITTQAFAAPMSWTTHSAGYQAIAPPGDVSDTNLAYINHLDLLAADAGVSFQHIETVLNSTTDLFTPQPTTAVIDTAIFRPDDTGGLLTALGIDNDHVYTMNHGTVTTAAPADHGGHIDGPRHLATVQPAENSGGAAIPARTRPSSGIV